MSNIFFCANISKMAWARKVNAGSVRFVYEVDFIFSGFIFPAFLHTYVLATVQRKCKIGFRVQLNVA